MHVFTHVCADPTHLSQDGRKDAQIFGTNRLCGSDIAHRTCRCLNASRACAASHIHTQVRALAASTNSFIDKKQSELIVNDTRERVSRLSRLRFEGEPARARDRSDIAITFPTRIDGSDLPDPAGNWLLLALVLLKLPNPIAFFDPPSSIGNYGRADNDRRFSVFQLERLLISLFGATGRETHDRGPSTT